MTMKKPTAKSLKPSKIKKPLMDKDLPVTKRLLDLKVQEVKGEITSLRLEVKAGFTKVDSKFEEIKVQITKMMVLLEEQSDRNRVALDGYATVYEKFNDTEDRLEKLEVRTFGNKQK